MKLLNNIYGKSEAFLLIIMGVSIALFALSDNYVVLMNPKYKWLTFGGSLMLVLFSIPSFFESVPKRHSIKIFFLLLFTVALLGNPFTPNNNTLMHRPAATDDLYDSIDLKKFPVEQLQNVLSETEEFYKQDRSFSVIGLAKRLDTLENYNSFALMIPIMVCCVADAYALGIRVPYENWESITDNEWVIVSGALSPRKEMIILPNFQTRGAMLSTIDKEYVLEPESIVAYNPNFAKPTISEILKEEYSNIFGELSEQSGILDDIDLSGGFTVFLPVNKGLENLGDEYFKSISDKELKRFVLQHFVQGDYLVKDLFKVDNLQNFNNTSLQINVENGAIKVEQSRLLLKDKKVKNGTIHYIYPPLIP